MPVIFFLCRCVNQAGISGRILRPEDSDAFEISGIGHHCGDFLDLFELVKICVRAHKKFVIAESAMSALHAGSLPFKFSGSKGPADAINFRAASTCSHTFHSNTPRTRLLPVGECFKVRIDFANRLVSGVIFMLEAHAFPSAGVVEYGHVSRGQMSASFVRRSSLTMTPFSVVKLIA